MYYRLIKQTFISFFILMLVFAVYSLYVLKNIDNWDRFVLHYHTTCVFENGMVACIPSDFILIELKNFNENELISSLNKSHIGKRTNSSIFSLIALLNKSNSDWSLLYFLVDIGITFDDTIFGCGVNDLQQVINNSSFSNFVSLLSDFNESSSNDCNKRKLAEYINR